MNILSLQGHYSGNHYINLDQIVEAVYFVGKYGAGSIEEPHLNLEMSNGKRIEFKGDQAIAIDNLLRNLSKLPLKG